MNASLQRAPRIALADCPVRTTLDVLRGKWKPLILQSLKAGRQRYSDLRDSITEPSDKMLIQQLRELERDEVIDRFVFAEVPPRVEYQVSAYGASLAAVVEQLAIWGQRHRTKKQRGKQ